MITTDIFGLLVRGNILFLSIKVPLKIILTNFCISFKLSFELYNVSLFFLLFIKSKNILLKEKSIILFKNNKIIIKDTLFNREYKIY